MQPPLSSSFPRLAVAAALLFAGAFPVSASLVQADFNDISGAPTDLTGRGGGGGLSGTWTGSNTTVDVVSGNLTSSNYSVQQLGGTSQKIDGFSPTDASLVNRNLTTALTGTVWTSFLLQNQGTNDRVGFSLNSLTTNAVNSELNFVLVGAGLRIRDNGTTLNTSGDFAAALNTTHLVLAQFVITGSSVEMNIYLNPSVASTLSPASLGAPIFSTTISGLFTGNQISTIGVQSYNSAATTGGQLDAIRLSDGSGNNTLGFLQTTRTTFFDNSNSAASYNWSTASVWQTTESSSSGQTWITDSNVVISRTTAAIGIDSAALSASSLEVRSGSALTLNGVAGSNKQLTVTGVVKGNLTLDGSAMASGETVSLVLANTSAPLDGKITLTGSGPGRAVLEINAGTAVSTTSQIAVNGNSRLRLNPGASGQTFTLGEISGNSASASIDDGTAAYTGTTTLLINQSTNTTLQASITKTSAGAGVFGLTKSGTGTLTLTGANSYNGNTLINEGTLVLGATGSQTFFIGANGVNNSISGSAPGLLTLDGTWIFDLTNAATTSGSSWQIVNAGFLAQTTFGTTFSITGFTESNNVWSNGGYQFSELTGVLSAIPEPSVSLLLAGGLIVVLLFRQRRMS